MKKRLLTTVLALVMVTSLFTVSAAGADKRPWEDAYRQAIKDNTDKYGWTVALADFDLDGIPELQIGAAVGNGLFSGIMKMYTFRDGSIREIRIEKNAFVPLGEEGYVMYRNDSTGAYKIEAAWEIRDGMAVYSEMVGTCVLQQDVYGMYTNFTATSASGQMSYQVNGQTVSKAQYQAQYSARNQGWTKVGSYGCSIHVEPYVYKGHKATDAQINAIFAAYPADAVHTVGGFQDVMSTDYYSDPVVWAATHDPQITNGTSPTTFSPNAECTRGQVVTFLWRASGCPEPKSDVNPFSDVDPQEYYGKAVLWAVENGITNGMGVGVFAPNGTVTRGQVVTFLWRMHDSPAVSGSAPFSDVPAGEYYADAVLWAVQQGVTNGKTAETFAPNDSCTRGQIVTFLYRDMK